MIPTKPILIYGTTWCPDCRRAKQFLGEHRVQYTWVDIEQDEAAMAEVERINEGKRIVPTIIFPDGEILTEPSNDELAAKLGLDLHGPTRLLRRDHHRRGAGRADHGHLHRARRAEHADPGEGRGRRPGGQHPAAGELPRLRPGHLGRGVRPTADQPGPAVRRRTPPGHRGRRHQPRRALPAA